MYVCSLPPILATLVCTLSYRTVLLLWGVNKFTKKLREADPIPTNEIDNLVIYPLTYSAPTGPAVTAPGSTAPAATFPAVTAPAPTTPPPTAPAPTTPPPTAPAVLLCILLLLLLLSFTPLSCGEFLTMSY